MKPQIHYLGIRHHGVGSAKRLVQALEQLQPDAVLIEGPADCSDLLPYLSERTMKPPIALLAYNDEHPDHHIYYPFTTYSPEYQAVLWGKKHHATVAFIDIPTDIQLNRPVVEIVADTEESTEEVNKEDIDNTDSLATDIDEEETAERDTDADEGTEEQQERIDIAKDPIGMLAKVAGYEDGESWWNDYFEQNSFEQNSLETDNVDTDNLAKDSTNTSNHDSLAVFAHVADAMNALRDTVDAVDTKDTDNADNSESERDQSKQHERNDVREAYMRLEIVKHIKAIQKAQDTEDEKPLTIVVVCGAWHVPALTQKVAQKDDKALVKTLAKKLPAKKIKRTWIPWTSNRLSRQSGYGAGVPAPMWYQHLWEYHGDSNWLAFWVGKIARAMRTKGHIVSTASVIEVVRLSHTMASVRGRPQAGFEEIIDAVIACLCFGEKLLWQQVSEELLLGHEVGSIPDNLPLAPLLEDLQRQQKVVKLKAETLSRELGLDLRSESGSKRSILLHRLNLLSVPWGQLANAGRSRGTFRENWLLEWQADYSVQLIENLVYGNSIEQASNNKVIEILEQDISLDKLAEYVQLALTSALDDATTFGLTRLRKQASKNTDVMSLLATLPHLVEISRYGTARKIDLSQIDTLIDTLVIQSACALPLECNHLSPEESERLRTNIQQAHNAIILAELSADLLENWWQALLQIAESKQANTSGLLVGLCNRLLYQAEKIDTTTVEDRLRYALSPALEVTKASQFFDGFFSEAVAQLHYDKRLLHTVNEWILSLNEEDFMTCLPLFMRTFSDLDKTERQRLLYTLLGRQKQASISYTASDELADIWTEHVTGLAELV